MPAVDGLAAGGGGSAARVIGRASAWLGAACLACVPAQREAPPPDEVAKVVAEAQVGAPAGPPEPAPTPTAAEACLSVIDEFAALGWTTTEVWRRAALHKRIAAAVAALPADEPRALEVLCRVAVARVLTGPEVDLLWLRAAEVVAVRPVLEPRARYASLLLPPVEIEVEYSWRSGETVLASRLEREAAGRHLALAPDACASVDQARLRLELAWYSKPNTSRLDELYAEIVAELGPDEPVLATLIDYGALRCSWTSCFELALALRERGLGPDHAYTRMSRLNLAVSLDSRGAEGRRAEMLLRRVAEAPIRDRSTLRALRDLGTRELLRRRWKPAARWLAEAARAADELLDPDRDSELIAQTRWMSVIAAHHVGDHAGAEAMLLRMQAASEYRDDARWFSEELAEVLCAAGRYDEAIGYYDRLLAAWREHEVGDMQHATMSVARALRARAAALGRLHREAERKQDLERAVWVELFGVTVLGPLEQGPMPEWMVDRVRRHKPVKTGR
jgi:tetratricopeptide (TPR) repeat protein